MMGFLTNNFWEGFVKEVLRSDLRYYGKQLPEETEKNEPRTVTG
jgi:hypothetical protein